MHASTGLLGAALLVVISMGPAHAHAAQATKIKKHTPAALRCMDPARIDEWHVIDARTVTVRNGPYRYVITTEHKCQRLGAYGAGIHFHLSESDKSSRSRICGGVGETVSSRDQPPCAIAKVKKIGKARFDALTRKAERSGNGAEQPGLRHDGH